jgi:hypothetical protein
MSFRVSPQGEIYNALRKWFAVGALLAWIMALMFSSQPDSHWLQRLGLLAAIFFSTGNVVLIYWPKETRTRREDNDEEGAAQ